MEEQFVSVSHHHHLTSKTSSSYIHIEEGDDPMVEVLSVDSEPTPHQGKSCHELAMEGEELSKTGDYSEAIPVLEAALESGPGDLQLTSVLWSLLGNAHFYQGDMDAAISCHSHDLAICCETNDDKSKAQAYCNLGIAHRKSGYLQKAKLCYESYLELCEILEDRRSISKANHNLGDLHMTLGRLKIQKDGGLENSPEGRDHLTMAAMYFEKHLEYIQDHGSKASECRAHGSLGIIYELLKDTNKAIDHHQKRLDIAMEISDKANIGRSYCSIGNCLRAILQPDKAMECYKRGLSVASEMDDQVGMGVCHCNMATTYEMMENVEETADQHEKQYQAMKNAGNIQGQIMALSSMAKIYETLANATKAIESLQKLVFLHRELKEEMEMKETLDKITHLGGSERELPHLVPPPSPPTSGTGKVENGGGGGGGGGKKGGIFKKLKEKRSKKRSIIGPETTQSVSGVIGQSWRSSSPGIKEEPAPKPTDKSKSTSKDTLVSKEDLPRSESRNSREERSSPQDRKRSWSHGNINKVSMESGDPLLSETFPSSSYPHKLTHSESVTLTSPVERVRGGNGGSTDQYVIHGPIPGETEQYYKLRKPIYEKFGDKSHHNTLKELADFLDSSEEREPVDLSILQDWDGWMIGSKTIAIQSTKESKLI